MVPEIRSSEEIQLVGIRRQLALSDGTIPELWKAFMPRRNEIANAVSANLYSVSVYQPPFNPQTFTTQTLFTKWAARQVTNFNHVPEGMQTLVIPSGDYAVFLYKGAPQNFAPFYRSIFFEWLPASNYVLDDRPHFELLDHRYSNNNPNSEEEIWVPVRAK